MKILLLIILLALPLYSFGQYRIAFNVLVDKAADDYDIFSMNPDGSDRRNITNHKDVAWTYYAYKNRLFFISDRDACKRCYFLYEMKADGSGVRKISDLQLEDSWMGSRNKGGEVIVSGRIGKDLRYQLFIIDTASGKHRQLTNENGAAHRDPSFSPDGKQVVFVYKKERLNRGINEELWIMDADGSNRRQLTTYPKDDKTAEWHSYHAGPPHWVAKHGFITYQSVQNGKSSLFAVTPDGKKQWKLTNNELQEGWHDWSPDGKWLAIEMFDKEEKEFGIFLMNWESKEIKKITDPALSKFQHSPVFVEFKGKMAQPKDEADLAKEFIDAFNKRDLDGMMALALEDVKWLTLAGEKLTTETADKPALRKFMEGYFKSCPSCKSSVTNINKNGSRVTMTETATWENEKGKQSNNSFAVYEFSGGKIARVYYYSEPAKSKFDAGLAKKLGADDYGMKQYVIAILKRGKAQVSKEERDKLMAGHMQNIAKLAQDKKLVLSGPYMENDDSRGIFILDVKTKEEAAKLVETDPAVKAGVFDVELRLWYGSAALLELDRIHKSIQAKDF